jgi:hypothetical protein
MNSSSKLINILIGKAVIETLLVAIIAVGSYANMFPPTFHGWGEAVSQTKCIAGWAVNNASPWERVQVQLFIDDKFIATQAAQLSRPDVNAAGWARDQWHGYSFDVPDLRAGSHEARVYAVHESGKGARYTLQLLGDPVQFDVDQNGAWRKVAER